MAIRYSSQTKTGDFDILDYEGRGHRIRFGGNASGQKVATDLAFGINEGIAPFQLGFQVPSVVSANLNTTDPNKLVYESNAIDLEIYTNTGFQQFGNLLQFDALLKTRAAANAAASFVLQLTGWENFDFSYIPPFIPEYTDMRGGELQDVSESVIPGIALGRSPWYQGGYNVYHKNWVDHRKSRKYCQIARPKLISANGAEIWGTISLDPLTGQLTYSFDPTFLANEMLPIRLDPTFGVTSIGGDTISGSGDRTVVGVASLSEAASSLDSISVYASAGASYNIKGSIFDDSGGAPNVRQDTGAAQAVSTAGWYTGNLSGGSLSSGTYYVGAITDGYPTFYHDFSTTNYGAISDNSGTYASPGNWNTAVATYGWLLSAYVTYTASGGGGGTLGIAPIIQNYRNMGYKI